MEDKMEQYEIDQFGAQIAALAKMAPPHPAFQTPVRLYMIGDTLYAEGPEKRFMVQAFWDQGWRREEAPALETPAPAPLPFSEQLIAECHQLRYRFDGRDLVDAVLKTVAEYLRREQ